jgi:hypothetical protein
MRTTTERSPWAWILFAGRPARGLLQAAILALVVCAPAFLFFGPLDSIARDPWNTYRLHSDDFPYLAKSRTWSRTVSNLFEPHNTHIVPAWRLLTWAMVAASGGRLSALPHTLGIASYAILVALMLLMGRFVARETGRAGLGYAAMVLLGTTSLMLSAASWYSAGQTLWAGFGILSTLSYLQSWKRSQRVARLVLACISAALAGWFWTVGHIAGPVGALYLWVDGRRRFRLAAIAPLIATAMAAGIGMGLGAGRIDGSVSFHGRSTREAIHPWQGVLHTAQAIPENLVLGNLGLSAQTTEGQGVILSIGLALLWAWTRRRPTRITNPSDPPPALSLERLGLSIAISPLEAVGGAIVLAAYLIEWTVRGYLPFSSLRGIVPWYDAIPHTGAVLFVSGWWAALASNAEPTRHRRNRVPLSRLGAIGVVGLALAMILLNRPRVDAQWRAMVPRMLPSEANRFKIEKLQNLRTSYILQDRAAWQTRHLTRLEHAEILARRQGIGLDAIREVFGRLDAPNLPPVYDAIDLLDLPAHGTEHDPAVVRRVLGPAIAMEPETRPLWINPDDPWPPPVESPSPAE